MSDHALPDNMEEWPVNLYELFGIEPRASERELRKAYHKLIKRFKPEHAPEQFRRLNEAYERLRVQLRYEEQYRQEETSADSDHSDWMDGTTWRTAPGPEDPVTLIEQQRTKLWQLALDGDLRSAAQQFESLCDENPDDEEALLRLYWLKRLTTGKPPLDRMERFLTNRGAACRTFPMYLLDLERDRSVALRESSRQLLLASVIRHETTQLAQSAWLQLVRQKQFVRIGHDLDDLKPELTYDQPMMWTLVVHQAAELLVLNKVARQHPLMQRLLQEIRECESTEENEWVESRWNLVQGVMPDSPPGTNRPDRLIDLVRDSMLGEPWEHRYRLERLAEPWLTSPASGLVMLDRLRHYSATAVYLLHRFAEQLLETRYRSYDRKYLEYLSPRLIEFASTKAPHSYTELREMLVHFCRREDLDLDQFINQMLELEKQGETFPILNDEVISTLNDDWALRCLISCVRIFNE